jgi:hypothetical protein
MEMTNEFHTTADFTSEKNAWPQSRSWCRNERKIASVPTGNRILAFYSTRLCYLNYTEFMFTIHIDSHDMFSLQNYKD